jgi:hypothetical protein
MEGNHIFESKAQNTNQSQGLKDPHDSRNTPQEKGITLPIKGNTSPANQAQAQGSMGPQPSKPPQK